MKRNLINIVFLRKRNESRKIFLVTYCNPKVDFVYSQCIILASRNPWANYGDSFSLSSTEEYTMVLKLIRLNDVYLNEKNPEKQSLDKLANLCPLFD